MGDWRKDRFLDDFLNAHQNDGNIDADENQSASGLENCVDLGHLSADDDDLVSYLSGEMSCNTSVTTNGSQKKSPNFEEFESQQANARMKSTKSNLKSQREPEIIELEVSGTEDCPDFGHRVSANDGDLILISYVSHHKTSKDFPAKEKSNVKSKKISLELDKRDLQSSAQNRPNASQPALVTEPGMQTDKIVDESSSCGPVASRNSQPEEPSPNVVRDTATKSKRNLCSSKYAVAARERRLKNKQHVAWLEETVKNLSEENEQLKKKDARKTQQIRQLHEEVRYLKLVITNKPTLSFPLENLSETTTEPKENQAGSTNSTTSVKRKHPDQVLVLDENSPDITNSSKRQYTGVTQAIMLISEKSKKVRKLL